MTIIFIITLVFSINIYYQVTLNIYCLNSAVGLVDIKDTLHSLVIASGTLSPMKSIQCELDVPFPISISLNHVVAEGQIFACVSTRGPERYAK